MAFISFHFFRQRPGTVVWAIYFSGNGPLDALHNSALVQELHARLGVYWWGRDRKSLMAASSDDSRPRVLLGELDRIAAAFDSTDRHRVLSSRARSVGKRLGEVGDAVLANGTWDLQAASLWIWRDSGTSVNISAIPKLASMIFTPDGAGAERVARAKLHRYKAPTGTPLPLRALLKLQPLSLRAALAEAELLAAELER